MLPRDRARSLTLRALPTEYSHEPVHGVVIGAMCVSLDGLECCGRELRATS